MRDAVCIADIISELTDSNLYWGVCVQGCQSPRDGTGFMDFGSSSDTKLYRTDYLSDCPHKIFGASLCKMRCSSGGGLFGMSAVRNQSAGKLSILRKNRAAGMECLCTLWCSSVTVPGEKHCRTAGGWKNTLGCAGDCCCSGATAGFCAGKQSGLVCNSAGH